MNPLFQRYAVLAFAVIVVSSSAIVIRYVQAESVPSLAIAAWRLTIASLLLWIWVIARPLERAAVRALPPRTLWLCVASGLFLAAHFATWISSLAFTSVASSAVLVATNPIWIALFAWWVLRERPGTGVFVGIAIAMLGTGVLILADAQGSGIAGSAPMLGNALALAGSLTVCGYLLIGRALRAKVSLVSYIAVVYVSAAGFLWVLLLASGQAAWGFSALAWAALIWLAVGPQLIGHSSFNWALKHFSAGFVALVTLAEPVGSAVLAWLLLGEAVGPMQLVGFALLLIGIFCAARAERPTT